MRMLLIVSAILMTVLKAGGAHMQTTPRRFSSTSFGEG
jgi:hypothetical protein